jgi:tetratricopeptide (TPR) repeat protein
MYYRSQIAYTILLAALVLAAWRSVVLARADAAFRAGDEPGVARAMALAPANTQYITFAALQTEYAGGDSRDLLERAARLNPLASEPRLRLGLAAELSGDLAAAERWLLDAYQVDRQFEVPWTLANFYFRQDRRGEFWQWMKTALTMSYGDRRPAFELCWRMSSEADEIAAQAIPDRAGVLRAYLTYLLDTDRAQHAPPVALRLLIADPESDRRLLYSAVDRLLDIGRASDAAAVWQAAGHARPSGITNGDFAQRPVEQGFDWRLSSPEGVTHMPLDPVTGHRVRLSGNQPEATELLRQVSGGLRPGGSYRLRWRSRTQGLRQPTGIAWNIAGASAGVDASAAETEGELRFAAPGEIALLTLRYTRPTGQVRAEGTLDLLMVAIEER